MVSNLTLPEIDEEFLMRVVHVARLLKHEWWQVLLVGYKSFNPFTELAGCLASSVLKKNLMMIWSWPGLFNTGKNSVIGRKFSYNFNYMNCVHIHEF